MCFKYENRPLEISSRIRIPKAKHLLRFEFHLMVKINFYYIIHKILIVKEWEKEAFQFRKYLIKEKELW